MRAVIAALAEQDIVMGRSRDPKESSSPLVKLNAAEQV